MKALLATAAFAAIVSAGAPATAQVYYGDNWNRNDPALRAFAQAQRPLTVQQRRNLARAQSDGRIHSPNPAWDVYDTDGTYLGSDPDPFIRNELARDRPGRNDD